MHGLKQFNFSVRDAIGKEFVSGLKVSILTAGGAIATIYSDEAKTALTNPITSTAFGTAKGQIKFWSAGTAFDIEIVDERGGHAKVQDFNGSDHLIVFDATRKDGQLAYASVADSAAFANTTTEAVIAETTIDGNDLKAGDILRIKASVTVAGVDSTPNLTLALRVGGLAATVDGEEILTTGACAVLAAGTGVLWCDVIIRIAGSGGHVAAHGMYVLGAQNTATAKAYIKADAAEALNLAALPIKLTADWSAAHASNTMKCNLLSVEVIHNGNV
jgi:hypothetical protein